MTTWTDEQKRAIVESGSNIIVSAGAGSGKTAVLSERVINKLQNGVHINELLILTFTRAAAQEMKDRIRKKISKNEELKSELNLLNSAYITTFDSYALSVVKKYQYILNIPNEISVTDESIIKINETRILDELFDDLYKEKSEKFTNLIKRYCIKNDSMFKKDILSLANKINKYIDKYEYIYNIRDNYFEKDNINKIIDEYKQFINNKKEHIQSLLDDAHYYFDENHVDKLYDATNSLLSSDIDELHLISKIDYPRLPAHSEEDTKTFNTELKNEINSLISYGAYGTLEDIENDIIDSKDTIIEILNIIEEYINRFEEFKRENQIYTFIDIASLAIKVVKENEDIRNEIRDSFKEIMIDEYQDTNDIQDSFIKLIENNNVYMVGDIKQSIYRFNGSNPEIFKEKYDNYSLNNGGKKIDLIKNFRSRSEVLNNINEMFELLMDDEVGGARYKESHRMIYKNEAYDTEKIDNYNYNMTIMEYEKVDNYSDSEIEIFTIAKDIKNRLDSKLKVFDKETNKLRPATYSDFVIILDRSQHFDDYKRIFEYLGIPLSILKNDKLNTSIDMNIIKNIIDLIIRINNNDYGVDFKYDFMSIGRSFLYEMNDEELFSMFKNDTFKESKLYKDFSDINNINSLTCGELFEMILDITDFYNKINKIGDYEDINVRLSTIYNLSNQFNNVGYTIEEFRDYLDYIIKEGIDINYESYNSNIDSVRIMTIHKSKGLEYPICYFADLDHKINIRDLYEKFIPDKKYGLLIPSNNKELSNTLVKELYKNSYMKDEISEKIRLFYVALTRAREKMIIVLPYKDTIKYETIDGVLSVNKRLSFTKLSDLIYSIKEYIPSYFEQVDIDSLGLTKKYLFKKKLNAVIEKGEKDITVENISISNDEITEEHFSKENISLITKETKENMEFGTKVHEVFELIDFKNYDESLIEDKFIRNKVTKFLNNELLLNIKDANIYHEYEFIYYKDEVKYHGIIDLIVEYPDYIDIIDFKLKNVKDEHYKEQLNGYKEYISKITNKKVNTYLYSIIDEKISEI